MTPVIAWTALILAGLCTAVLLSVAGALLWVLRRPALALPALAAIATGPLVKPTHGATLCDVATDLSAFTLPEE
jgi:uncharacterized iron-regulated membrane protein